MDRRLPLGIQDLTAEGKSYVYVMEQKMDCNGGVASATNQIRARHYADVYAASEKKVISLALDFSKESRGLKRWNVVE